MKFKELIEGKVMYDPETGMWGVLLKWKDTLGNDQHQYVTAGDPITALTAMAQELEERGFQ